MVGRGDDLTRGLGYITRRIGLQRRGRTLAATAPDQQVAHVKAYRERAGRLTAKPRLMSWAADEPVVKRGLVELIAQFGCRLPSELA